MFTFHVQLTSSDWKPFPVGLYSVIICDDHTYIRTYNILYNTTVPRRLQIVERQEEKPGWGNTVYENPESFRGRR